MADSNSTPINIGPNATTSATTADQTVGSCSPPAAFTFTSTTTPEGMARDRRASDEWDAAKVPPSRFQKRKGSIYSTPNSRDGQVAGNYAAKFHAKHAELGYSKR